MHHKPPGPGNETLSLATQDIILSFTFPQDYIGEIVFKLLSSIDVRGPYADTLLTPIHVGGDQFEASVPLGTSTSEFFRVLLELP